MLTLAIDTSTTVGSVALRDDSQILAETTFGRDGLFSALQKFPATPPDEILIGVGPGSFTGIRAGIAAAKGLALPRQLPVRAANSFDAIARTALPALPRDCPQLCVLSDARREEIYYRLYDRTGQPTTETQLGPLEEIELHNPIWFVSAEMEKFRDILRQTFGGFATVCDRPVFPKAALLQPTDLPLEPVYLRETDFRKS